VLDQHGKNLERAPTDRQGYEKPLLILLEQHTGATIEPETLEQVNIRRGDRDHARASYAAPSKAF